MIIILNIVNGTTAHIVFIIERNPIRFDNKIDRIKNISIKILGDFLKYIISNKFENSVNVIYKDKNKKAIEIIEIISFKKVPPRYSVTSIMSELGNFSNNLLSKITIKNPIIPI